MTEYPAGRGQRSSDLTPGLRLTALIAVIIGVLLLAVAAFLLSYSGIHHIALQAGVSPRLARFYPGIFDAMLVIVCAALLALRGAGWLTRVYVWLCLIVLLAAVATADAVHAMGVAIPRQPARAGVAITPWALVLLSFGLLLAMLRYLRRVRSAGRGPARTPAGAPGGPDAPASASREGLDSLLEPRAGEPPALPTTEHPPPAAALPAATGEPATATSGPTIGSPATGGSYSADAYYGADTPEGTEEYYEHEGYEDYAEEFPAADAEHAGGPGEETGQPAGQDNGEGAGAGDTLPAPAPAGPFDRLHSSPTRPQD